MVFRFFKRLDSINQTGNGFKFLASLQRCVDTAPQFLPMRK